MSKPKTSPVSLILTQLPDDIIDSIITTLKDDHITPKPGANVLGDDLRWAEYKRIRDTNNAHIPGNHWYLGMIWYFIMRMNHWNFQYDIESFDADSVDYLEYGPGQHYTWHTDMIYPLLTQEIPHTGVMQPTTTEKTRKLSFTLLLNDDYTGGELQFYYPGANSKAMSIPKRKGQLIIFDSRIVHRVTRVKEGLRKSMVGWVVGPRWK
jgi:hypothetical protein